ncbi:M20/M25/M40 family metallo-hydrolase, partial [Candidatus Micrarchaeota archaeon]|nr:M20/M25/M40 family metallo-hydrolase [Candidatus Micrarchaeota archaeon]
METIALTKKLIKFKTVQTRNKELHKCIGFIKNYFKGKKLFVEKFQFNKIPSLFVCTKKTLSPKILLLVHMDVVEAEPEQFTPKIKGNKLFGRGAYDMKAGAAIAMNSLLSLSPKHSVGVLFTSDEESSAFNGARIFAEKGFRGKLIIALDGGSPKELVIKSKGVLRLKVSAKGRDGHPGKPWKGENAIEKLILAYPEIRKLFPGTSPSNRWKPTLTPSIINGGSTINVVPPYAEMFIDIRYPDEKEINMILKKIKKIKGIKTEVLLFDSLMETSPKNPLVQKLKKTMKEETHSAITLKKEHGASDARHFSAKGIPCVLFTPKGKNLHAKNEF